MKFKIKNCPNCLWFQSPQRLEPKEFCYLHRNKEDQPPAIKAGQEYTCPQVQQHWIDYQKQLDQE